MRPFILIMISLFLSSVSAFAATLHVPEDHASIMDAIKLAANGDTILVGPGTYEENVSFLGKALILKGEHGPAATVIDGVYNVMDPTSVIRVVGVSGGTAVLDGFTITNGYANLGGGVFCQDCDLWIRHCNIEYNETIHEEYGLGHGAGIYCDSATLRIDYSMIRFNSILIDWFMVGVNGGSGGGIYASPTCTLDLYKCIVSYNESGWGGSEYGGYTGDGGDGGGICCSNATMHSCRILFNEAGKGGGSMDPSASAGDGGDGGGIFGINVTLNNCEVTGNKSGDPGFYLLMGSGPGNGGDGGGLYLKGVCSLINCTVAGNETGAYETGPPYPGEAGGIYYGTGSGTITSSIVWDNDPEQTVLVGTTQVTYTDISGGYPGIGNIDLDPEFIAGPHGDYYLSQPPEQATTSPCVDAGDPGSGNMVLGTTRTDGIQDENVVDMGFHYTLRFIPVPDLLSSIQEAIAYAKDGGEVLVAPGTYSERINLLGRAITLRSDVDGDPDTVDLSPLTTIIQGSQDGSVLTFNHGEGESTVLKGFTITNGSGDSYPYYSGGGITCDDASPMIDSVVIQYNSTSYAGGGICCHDGAAPEIINSILFENEADYYGGGIACYDANPLLMNTTVSLNRSPQGFGGGIGCWLADPVITNTIIQ
ncbi:MAG: right-handed parallel beta-helix repeat-containing protein, partial [Planctomycetota bacterium]